jgi:hypothetical protein
MGLKPETANELRGMVRELLRDALAGRATKAGIVDVRISSDAELSAFVARLAEPGVLDAVRSGKLRFKLAQEAMPAAASAPSSAAPLDGVITEQKLNRLNGGGTVVLSPTAVLTPLARDRARALGLKFERRR